MRQHSDEETLIAAQEAGLEQPVPVVIKLFAQMYAERIVARAYGKVLPSMGERK